MAAPIRKAVIPIAGLGTRMFPTSVVIPKAFFPIVAADGKIIRPFLHHLLRDIFTPTTGIQQVCIIISEEQRPMLTEYFSIGQAAAHPAWAKYRARGGVFASEADEAFAFGQRMTLVVQNEPRGFGDAVLRARDFIGDDEFFLLALGDHLYVSQGCDVPCIEQFLHAHRGRSMTAVGIIPAELANTVGVMQGTDLGADRVFTVSAMIEKPSADEARARWIAPPEFELRPQTYLCNFGLDILPRRVFDVLANQTHKGELELRSAQATLLKESGMLGYFVRGERYDTGLPLLYLETLNVIAHAAHHKTLAATVPTDRALSLDEAGAFDSAFPGLGELTTALLKRAGHAYTPVRTLFDPHAHIFVGRGPARLDVMGGIADYSGSLVLQYPLREATVCAVQPRTDGVFHIVSLASGTAAQRSDAAPPLEFSMNARTLAKSDGSALEYAEARALLSADPKWPAYVLGFLVVLCRELPGFTPAKYSGGFNVLLQSSVPQGKGVASSASCEVAFASAVCAALGIKLDQKTLGAWCQKVENLVVGAPCGIMDQLASSCGRDSTLLRLRCQPAELEGTVALPQGVEVWGIDSGAKHSVGGGLYPKVRAAAFMGRTMLFRGADCERWRGHLANIPPSEFASLVNTLPESMKGSEFQAMFPDGHGDSITRVNPDEDYPVRAATQHPVDENSRVEIFAELLGALGDSTSRAETVERRMVQLGELMYQSHASYSRCGLGSRETDMIVELVRKRSPAHGLYGAKITGGGSGGTVAILARAGCDAAVREVADAYKAQTGKDPYIFHDSSAGAAASGAVQLQL